MLPDQPIHPGNDIEGTNMTDKAQTLPNSAFLPCPFCGCEDIRCEETICDSSVWCSSCGAKHTRNNFPRDRGMPIARSNWNRRVDKARTSPETDHEIERLRNAIRIHAGDVMSLSNELEEWRSRALAAEAALARPDHAQTPVLQKHNPFRAALIEACARFADGLMVQDGRTAEWHDAARSIPSEIRALAQGPDTNGARTNG